MDSDTSIFFFPSLIEGLLKGIVRFCLSSLQSLLFHSCHFVSGSEHSKASFMAGEHTAPRACRCSGGAGRGWSWQVCRYCIGHQMCMAKDSVNSDHYLDFRHYLLMGCICRELKKIGSLKFDGETKVWGNESLHKESQGCLDTWLYSLAQSHVTLRQQTHPCRGYDEGAWAS